MPNFLKIAWVCLFISITFIQCKKEDTLSSNVPSMTCKINGQTWSASGSKAIAQIFQSQINITGQADDGTSITLTIESLNVGLYNLVEKGSHIGVYTTNNTISSFTSSQGSDNFAKVVISDINTANATMSGTFQFTGFRTSTGTKVVVSDGVFKNVKFISKPNLFSCNMDGTAFSSAYTSGDISTDYLKLSGWTSDYSKNVTIYLQPNVSVGFIRFGEAYSKNFVICSLKGASNTYTIFYTNAKLLGGVTISKHDKNAKIIEGNFAFQAEEISRTKTMDISQGSFFIKY